MPGAKSSARAHGLFGELRQRRVLLAQLVVVGQLIGQAGDVRQQVTNRHLVPPVARERGQELLHAVVELKLPSIEQGHDGRHVDRLGNGAEQEHRVARGGLAEVARERLVPLHHVQHGRVHLLRRRGPLEHFGRVLPPLPAQGREQGGAAAHGQGRPKKRASLHRTRSSAVAKRVGAMRGIFRPKGKTSQLAIASPPTKEVSHYRTGLRVTYRVRLSGAIPPIAGVQRARTSDEMCRRRSGASNPIAFADGTVPRMGAPRSMWTTADWRNCDGAQEVLRTSAGCAKVQGTG